MNICRFCHRWETERSSIIKYGVRHSAHLHCLIERNRLDVLSKLSSWQLERLPFFQLKDLGLLDHVQGIIASRKQP